MSNRFSLSGISQIPLPTDEDEPTKTEIAAANRAAERTGFTSADIEPRTISPRRRKEPSTQISVRLPISVSERLRDYCEENRYTYGQIIEIWMKEKKI
jgi:hypothetical protein